MILRFTPDDITHGYTQEVLRNLYSRHVTMSRETVPIHYNFIKFTALLFQKFGNSAIAGSKLGHREGYDMHVALSQLLPLSLHLR